MLKITKGKISLFIGGHFYSLIIPYADVCRMTEREKMGSHLIRSTGWVVVFPFYDEKVVSERLNILPKSLSN